MYHGQTVSLAECPCTSLRDCTCDLDVKLTLALLAITVLPASRACLALSIACPASGGM